MIHRAVFKYGRGESEYEFTKDGNRWKHRKVGEEKWKSSTSVWAGKFERHLAGDNGQLTLFETPRRVTIKDLAAQVEEIKKSLIPAESDELSTLEVNDDSILRPDYVHPDIEGILGGPLPKHRVFARPHIRGDRHYLYGIPNDDRDSARPWLIMPPLPGVTSIIKRTCPTPESLIKWIAGFPGGYQASRDHTDLMAAKGTIMHGVLADVVNGLVPEMGSPDWHRYMEVKLRKQRVDPKHHNEFEQFMRKSILSFLQWVEDYEVTIILMEIALVSESLGYAGQVDLFCEINDKKYTKPVWDVVAPRKPKAKKQSLPRAKKIAAEWTDAREAYSRRDGGETLPPTKWGHSGDDMSFSRREPWINAITMDEDEAGWDVMPRIVHNPRKRVKAIVDFKSGEHSHETHAIQLGFYVPLFREAFPDCDLAGMQVWNWHPSDWDLDKETCSYKFINQSLKLNQRRTDLLLGIYNLDARTEVAPVVQIKGIPRIGVKPSELITRKPFIEHWEETFHLALDLGLNLE